MNAPAYIRLGEAAAKFGLSVSALRAEAKRGHLAVSRVANKDWTTEQAVREMFERCRVAAPRQDSTSEIRESAPETDTAPFGSSSTVEANLALAAALATARALKGRSPSISPKNTKRRAENVVFLKSESQT